MLWYSSVRDMTARDCWIESSLSLPISHHNSLLRLDGFIDSYSGLGTHISFVRSVLMDSWTDREMEFMKEAGGNDASRAFLEKHGLENFESLTAREKYESPQGELWRRVLQARVNGTPEPTELPEIVVPSTNSNTKSRGKKKMEGFGSSPRPRETNERSRDIKRCLYVTATVVLGAAIWVVVPH